MSFSSTTARVFSGYRRLFRARNKLFQGDQQALRESRIAIRQQFEMNRNIAQVNEELFAMIDEAEDMMLHGIVQGKLNKESGQYQVKVKPEHTTQPDDGIVADADSSQMEPISEETVRRMEKASTSDGKPEITVTKTETKNDKNEKDTIIL